MLLNLYAIGETNKELMTRTYKQLVRSEKLLAGQEDKILIFEDILKEIKESDLQFSLQEQQYLSAKGTLKLCVDPAWMPLEGIVDTKHIGIAADFFELIRKKSSIAIELYPTSSWQESLEAAKRRDCDLFSLASQTLERSEYMDFTKPYIISPIVLVTKVDKQFVDDVAQLGGKKIGVVSGYAIGKVLETKYPNIHIVPVKNADEAMRMVEKGELYGYADNLIVSAAIIAKDFIGILKISARFSEEVPLAIGTRNDEPLLHSIFEKIVASISENDKQRILNDWISVEESVGMNYALLFKILLVVAAIFIVIIVYNFQLKTYNRKLEELSTKDTLTKINNRLKLDEILDIQEKNLDRHGGTCGIILADIDDFKKVNDTYGHLIGDTVLKQFADVLVSNVRQSDTVGRWGGEEFMIICPNTNINSLKVVAQTLRSKIENTTFVQNLPITASFGLNEMTKNQKVYNIIDGADKALYIAKEKGKNRCEVYATK